MHIRRAIRADCLGLAQVQVGSYRSAYAPFLPRTYLDQFSVVEQEQDWRDLLATTRADLLLVAEARNGTIAGYALGEILPGGSAWATSLNALHVQQSHQQTGIGSRLFDAVAQSFQEDGRQSMTLSTFFGTSAAQWYRRLGAVPHGEVRYEIDGTAIAEQQLGWPDLGALRRALHLQQRRKLPLDALEHALQHDRLCDISTTGRHSGQTRRIEIWFHHLDGQIYLTGRPGKRDWFANLQANPLLTFHLKQSLAADLSAWATVDIPPHARRTILTRLLEESAFRDATEEWISGSPLARIDFAVPVRPAPTGMEP